ncbi:helix-turn-helix domain-containing protein [Streptomyces sp. NPDC050698]
MAGPPSPLSHDERRTELRGFLRSRRARVSPADVGMTDGGRRRTPGLRREEVAVLADVGVSWYTWLEQGRDIKVSGQVLDAVARVLLLDSAERAHLYRLAGLNPPQPSSAPGGTASPEVRRLLDAWSPRPGYVRDRHWNFAAVNDPARLVFGYGESDHNCLISFFTNTRYCPGKRDGHCGVRSRPRLAGAGRGLAAAGGRRGASPHRVGHEHGQAGASGRAAHLGRLTTVCAPRTWLHTQGAR